MTLWRRVVGFVSRVRDLCARRRLAREAEQEIEMHLDLLAEQYVRAGQPPAEARRLARAKFGGVVQDPGIAQGSGGLSDARVGGSATCGTRRGAC